jgi:hypothetical protein
MIGITRSLSRLTPSAIHSGGKRRQIVLELDPHRPGLVGFRLQRTRTTYYLPVEHLFREALRLELARQRTERKRIKKESRS